MKEKGNKLDISLMLYEMACQAAWDRKIVYFKITRGKVDFLFCRRKPDEQIFSMKYFLL